MKKTNSILEIDLNIISNNVDILKSHCGPTIKFLAVIKADAYGHGAVKVAQKIAHKTDWFAVNDIHEGIELRKNGIEHPILVFMPPENDTSTLYSDFNLTATVGDEEHLQLLGAGTNYHFLFDTGMGRLGFSAGDAEKVAGFQVKYEKLNCTGIYSHFATADDPKSTKVNEQLESFKKARFNFEDNLLTHLCNTGGIAQAPEAYFNMVRSGIGIYGFGPGRVNINELRPAMKWKSRLVQVKAIKKGETVSYGSSWRCPEDGFLGIIPVGFDDGLRRQLTSNLQVKIKGEYYSTVGIITMNYTMVYLQKQGFETGTEVLLLGDKFTARDWADAVGTISYEIMTGISPKIPRKYV